MMIQGESSHGTPIVNRQRQRNLNEGFSDGGSVNSVKSYEKGETIRGQHPKCRCGVYAILYKSRTCSKCGEAGHNCKTCKGKLKEKPASRKGKRKQKQSNTMQEEAQVSQSAPQDTPLSNVEATITNVQPKHFRPKQPIVRPPHPRTSSTVAADTVGGGGNDTVGGGGNGGFKMILTPTFKK